MKKSLLLIPVFSFLSTFALASTPTGTVNSSCSGGSFTIAANFNAGAMCTYDEVLVIEGVTTTNQFTFDENFSRNIPLSIGETASVTSMFQCSSLDSSGTFNLTNTSRTSNGCVPEVSSSEDVVIEEEIADISALLIEEALAEVQQKLDVLLQDASDEIVTLEKRADRFRRFSERSAERVLTSGIARLERSTNRELNRIINTNSDILDRDDIFPLIVVFADSFRDLIANR